MEKFKEKKIVNILDRITLSFLILLVLSFILLIFNDIFLFGLSFLLLAVITNSISEMLSQKRKYTNDFISYIEEKIKEVSSLDDLEELLSEFENLSIENGVYILDYPNTLRELHKNILSKIEIIKIIESNKK
jgi:hypothetical protein